MIYSPCIKSTTWNLWHRVILGACCLVLLHPGLSLAAPAGRKKVAEVNGEPIYNDQVEVQLQKTLGKDQVLRLQSAPDAEETMPRLRAEMLQQMVKQRLVEGFLAQGESTVLNGRDLDAAVENFKQELKEEGKQSLEEYLEEQGWTDEGLRHRLAWTIAWPKYLATQMTQQRLDRYFEAHRVQFDGTTVRARQIFLKLNSPTPAVAEKTLAQMQELRQQIAQGKLDFAEAAKRYSQAPSAAAGGDLGFFSRKEMPEALSQVAFALKPEEMSQPFVSPFGVHLLQLMEIRKGRKTAQEVRTELEPLVAQEVFAEVAAREAKKAKISYTGLMPYLDDAGQLVQPKE